MSSRVKTGDTEMEMVQGDKWMTPALWFFSHGDAVRYYAAQGVGSHDVGFKFATGEIRISDAGIKFGSPADPYPWVDTLGSRK